MDVGQAVYEATDGGWPRPPISKKFKLSKIGTEELIRKVLMPLSLP